MSVVSFRPRHAANIFDSQALARHRVEIGVVYAELSLWSARVLVRVSNVAIMGHCLHASDEI